MIKFYYYSISNELVCNINFCEYIIVVFRLVNVVKLYYLSRDMCYHYIIIHIFMMYLSCFEIYVSIIEELTWI